MIDGIKIQFKTEYLFCKIFKEGLAVSGDSENVKERISIFKEDHAHKERAEKFEGGEKMETIKKILANDKVKVALWVGVSYLVTQVLSALLQMPELNNFYGVINILLYVAKNFKK